MCCGMSPSVLIRIPPDRLQSGDNILARHRFFMGEVHNVVRRTLTDFTDN
jgi:hypothetical protein